MKNLLKSLLLLVPLVVPSTAHAEATTLSPWSSFAHDRNYGGTVMQEMGPYQAVAMQARVRAPKGHVVVDGDVDCWEATNGPTLIGSQHFHYTYRVRRPHRPVHTLRIPVPSPGADGCEVTIMVVGNGWVDLTLQARFIVPA